MCNICEGLPFVPDPARTPRRTSADATLPHMPTSKRTVTFAIAASTEGQGLNDNAKLLTEMAAFLMASNKSWHEVVHKGPHEDCNRSTCQEALVFVDKALKAAAALAARPVEGEKK